jgi:hypothetical protein
MTHQEIQMLVSSYCDHEVNNDEATMVESHTKVCHECRQFVQHAKRLRSEIQLLGEGELSQAFTARVVHSLENQEHQKEEWLGIEPLARNTFYAITLVVFIMYVLTSSSDNSQNTSLEQLLSGAGTDSTASQILLQHGELTKNDLLYAVMSK